MYSKRALGYDETATPPSKRLRRNIADLFLANEVSGTRAQSLLADAAASGSAGVSDLQNLGGRKHAHRNLLRRLAKGSRWPSLYEAEVRAWNAKATRVERVVLAFLLPHEILGHLRKHCRRPAALLDRSGLDASTRANMQTTAASLGLPLDKTVACSLWLDGVACKWDRSESIDVVTLALPGAPGRHHDLRFPVCALPHGFVAKDVTFDDILAIVAWSLRWAALGVFANGRHDEAAWCPA